MRKGYIIILISALVSLFLLPMVPQAYAQEPIEQLEPVSGNVTDIIEPVPIDKQPTDPQILNTLQAKGIDKSYVELKLNYGRREEGKSPYSIVYKDLKSDTHIMMVSILPHADAEGDKLKPGWLKSDGNYYSKTADKAVNNLFWAEVSGTRVTLITETDQPTGLKGGDGLVFQPQLFLNGKEQYPVSTEPKLLAVDPLNDGYTFNTLEWDYGIAKRWVRVIEGGFQGRWVFGKNPGGEILIRYNQDGDFRLKLSGFAVSEDEELVPKVAFDSPLEYFYTPNYPVTVTDSLTFYPDPDVETSSVDGRVQHEDTGGLTWAAIVDGAGTGEASTSASNGVMIFADGLTNKFQMVQRTVIVFPTSGLPDTAIISGATLSAHGSSGAKMDELNCAPTINVYSSNPASNTALQASDYEHINFGTTAFSTAITYAGWDDNDYNDWILNASGIDAISRLNVTKFAFREATYDVAEELDSGAADPNWIASKISRILSFSADQGDTSNDPKLVIAYTVPPPSPPASPTSLTLIDLGGITISANWSAADNATSYLLLVDRDIYPDSANISLYELAYSGNLTSANLTGFDLNDNEFLFSLWANSASGYSENYTMASIGDKVDWLEFITESDMETLAETLESFLAPIGLFNISLLSVAIFGLAFWRRSMVLFVLAGISTLIFGLYFTDTHLAIGVLIAILGLYCFWKAAETKL